MIRFGFTARLMIIFVASLVALQLLAVMIYFTQRSRSTNDRVQPPLPSQVAALVQLFETVPPAQRSLLLQAANSSELIVSIQPEKPELAPENWQPSPYVERWVKDYLKVLGEREVAVLLQPGAGAPKRYGPLAMIYPAAVRIFVAMQTGETLVIETSGILSIRIFGWPPGFWAGLFGFLIAVAVYFSVRAEAKPLRELAQAVDRFDLDGRGEPSPDQPRSAPEIRALIKSFNTMRDRLAVLMKTRLALVGGISHDLRTYTTRLRLRAELIPDEMERERAIHDIDEMTQLLDDSLLAFAANGASSASAELVDVVEILSREAGDWHAAGHSVFYAPRDGNAFVLGRAIALRRLFANLIDNAIKYGRKAYVNVAVTGLHVIVHIDDDGPGIPACERAAVLEPFVRLETSRNRKTGGAGLGLAIAKTVAESHGGSLALSDAKEGGNRVIVTLPRFQAA